VAADQELQAWALDLSQKGFSGLDRGFPSSIQSIDKLCEICTTCIFTVSVQHAALNFYQFESFAFVPVAPGAMSSPAPGMLESWS
jgi:arachidonate 5-lipoxygenase